MTGYVVRKPATIASCMRTHYAESVGSIGVASFAKAFVTPNMPTSYATRESVSALTAAITPSRKPWPRIGAPIS